MFRILDLSILAAVCVCVYVRVCVCVCVQRGKGKAWRGVQSVIRMVGLSALVVWYVLPDGRCLRSCAVGYAGLSTRGISIFQEILINNVRCAFL